MYILQQKKNFLHMYIAYVHSAVLEKNSIQVIVFNKKAVAKVLSPIQRAHHETLLNFVASFSK